MLTSVSQGLLAKSGPLNVSARPLFHSQILMNRKSIILITAGVVVAFFG
jgi:hypothetical protein